MNLSVTRFELDGVLLIKPRLLQDFRGHFTETYRVSAFAEIGIEATFVQENEVFSAKAGIIRGLHFQKAPQAQAKLVRVVRGSIFDVAVDIRPRSTTFGRWIGVDLTAEGAEQLFVPRGFAHGYCSREADTQVIYKCDAYYAPEREAGINFADPVMGIAWPVSPEAAILSARDRQLPSLLQVKADLFSDGTAD